MENIMFQNSRICITFKSNEYKFYKLYVKLKFFTIQKYRPKLHAPDK